MTMLATARPIYWWGRKKEGTLLPIPKEMLTETVPGAIYELHIKCDKPPEDPEQAINVILTELPKKVPVKIHYIEVEGDTIKIQLEGSPLDWSIILAAIPLILGLIGLTILFIAIYEIFASIPGWVIGLLIVGFILLWFLPGIGDLIRGFIEIFAPPEKRE